jgi:GAF domain-containing protein/HAMP domain-containing protein
MKRFFESVTFKIGIIIILVEIIVFAITGFFYVERFSAQIDERIRSRIEVPGTLVARGLLNFGSVADENVMNELVGEGLIDGMVIGADGLILHSLNPNYVRQQITALPEIDPAWFDDELPGSLLIETADNLVSITPIRALANEKTSFFVYIKIGTLQTQQQKTEILWLFILGSVFSVAITTLVIVLLFNSTILGRIKELVNVAGQVEAGNLSIRVRDPSSLDEIGLLQRSVNSMATQLEEIVHDLEERVTNRTHRLEMVASLGERLSAILDFDKLLAMIVNQVKENFGYYHAHIYLFDDTRENLVVAEGTGPAGEKMKANKHSILVRTPKSLVARAARTGRIVKVDNVREVDDWLPNPLLPDTYAEMAVPIILNEQVVGVLDVQQDKVGGLDAGDMSLLRSLASQVAVALNNALLFEQTRTALAETEAAHQRYLAQAWTKFQETQPVLQAEQKRPGNQQVNLEAIDAIKQQAVHDRKPMIITPEKVNDNDHNDSVPATVIAPLKLREQVIGTLGVLDTETDRRWTPEEIALIETISEQASLALENVRLFDETSRRAGREKVIADVTRQVWASGELEQVMQTAVSQLGATLDASKVVIRLGTVDQLAALSTTVNEAAETSST